MREPVCRFCTRTRVYKPMHDRKMSADKAPLAGKSVNLITGFGAFCKNVSIHHSPESVITIKLLLTEIAVKIKGISG